MESSSQDELEDEFGYGSSSVVQTQLDDERTEASAAEKPFSAKRQRPLASSSATPPRKRRATEEDSAFGWFSSSQQSGAGGAAATTPPRAGPGVTRKQPRFHHTTSDHVYDIPLNVDGKPSNYPIAWPGFSSRWDPTLQVPRIYGKDPSKDAEDDPETAMYLFDPDLLKIEGQRLVLGLDPGSRAKKLRQRIENETALYFYANSAKMVFEIPIELLTASANCVADVVITETGEPDPKIRDTIRLMQLLGAIIGGNRFRGAEGRSMSTGMTLTTDMDRLDRLINPSRVQPTFESMMRMLHSGNATVQRLAIAKEYQRTLAEQQDAAGGDDSQSARGGGGGGGKKKKKAVEVELVPDEIRPYDSTRYHIADNVTGTEDFLVRYIGPMPAGADEDEDSIFGGSRVEREDEDGVSGPIIVTLPRVLVWMEVIPHHSNDSVRAGNVDKAYIRIEVLDPKFSLARGIERVVQRNLESQVQETTGAKLRRGGSGSKRLGATALADLIEDQRLESHKVLNLADDCWAFEVNSYKSVLSVFDSLKGTNIARQYESSPSSNMHENLGWLDPLKWFAPEEMYKIYPRLQAIYGDNTNDFQVAFRSSVGGPLDYTDLYLTVFDNPLNVISIPLDFVSSAWHCMRLPYQLLSPVPGNPLYSYVSMKRIDEAVLIEKHRRAYERHLIRAEHIKLDGETRLIDDLKSRPCVFAGLDDGNDEFSARRDHQFLQNRFKREEICSALASRSSTVPITAVQVYSSTREQGIASLHFEHFPRPVYQQLTPLGHFYTGLMETFIEDEPIQAQANHSYHFLNFWLVAAQFRPVAGAQLVIFKFGEPGSGKSGPTKLFVNHWVHPVMEIVGYSAQAFFVPGLDSRYIYMDDTDTNLPFMQSSNKTADIGFWKTLWSGGVAKRNVLAHAGVRRENEEVGGYVRSVFHLHTNICPATFTDAVIDRIVTFHVWRSHDSRLLTNYSIEKKRAGAGAQGKTPEEKVHEYRRVVRSFQRFTLIGLMVQAEAVHYSIDHTMFMIQTVMKRLLAITEYLSGINFDSTVTDSRFCEIFERVIYGTIIQRVWATFCLDSTFAGNRIWKDEGELGLYRIIDENCLLHATEEDILVSVGVITDCILSPARVAFLRFVCNRIQHRLQLYQPEERFVLGSPVEEYPGKKGFMPFPDTENFVPTPAEALNQPPRVDYNYLDLGIKMAKRAQNETQVSFNARFFQEITEEVRKESPHVSEAELIAYFTRTDLPEGISKEKIITRRVIVPGPGGEPVISSIPAEHESPLAVFIFSHEGNGQSMRLGVARAFVEKLLEHPQSFFRDSSLDATHPVRRFFLSSPILRALEHYGYEGAPRNVKLVLPMYTYSVFVQPRPVGERPEQMSQIMSTIELSNPAKIQQLPVRLQRLVYFDPASQLPKIWSGSGIGEDTFSQFTWFNTMKAKWGERDLSGILKEFSLSMKPRPPVRPFLEMTYPDDSIATYQEMGRDRQNMDLATETNFPDDILQLLQTQ